MTSTRASFTVVFAGRVWSAGAVYLFLPSYLAVMGRDGFGLVAFAVLLGVAASVVVSGWTKSLRREFSRPSETDVPGGSKYLLLRSFESVTAAFGGVVLVAIFLAAPWIDAVWLPRSSLPSSDTTSALRLIGLSIFLQLLGSCYSSCLHGLLLQGRVTLLDSLWVTCRGASAVFAGLISDGSVVAFFLGFVVADFAYVAIGRTLVLKELSRSEWSWGEVRQLTALAPLSIGITVTAVVYFFNTQTDKAVVSRLMGLGALGDLNIAMAFAQVPVVLTTAIALTVFPRLVRAWSSGGLRRLSAAATEFHSISSWLVFAVSFPMSLFTYEIVSLWTSNEALAKELRWVSLGALVGSAALSLQQVVYEALTARGITRLNVAISLACLPYSLAVTPFLVAKWGLLGAAWSWAFLMATTTIVYLGVAAKGFLGIPLWRLHGRGVLLPAITSSILAVSAKGIFVHTAPSSCVLAVVLVGCSFAGSLGIGYMVHRSNFDWQAFFNKGKVS